MVRGNVSTRNIIDKHSLGGIVRELVAKGNSFSQIVELIKEKRGITLNRMNISRYIKNITDKRISPQQVRSRLGELRQESITNTNTLLSEFDNLSKELQN